MIKVSTALFVLILINILMTAAYNYSGSETFSTLNNAVAIATLALAAAATIRTRRLRKGHAIFAVILAAAVLCTIVANVQSFKYVDVIKYAGIYVLFGCGYYAVVSARWTRWQLVLLAVIPLVTAVALKTKVYDPGIAFSFFPNANTATLYYTAVLFAGSEALGAWAIIIQFIQVVAFRKVGAVVATVAAFFFWNARRLNRRTIAIIGASGAAAVVLALLGFLDRPIAVVSSLFAKVTSGGVGDILNRSYGDLVAQQGTTDLSGYFRIKHWAEIWSNYSGGDLATVLFGYGPGATPSLTTAHLIPHNDYLRVLAEFGLVNFVLFMTLNVYILRAIGSKQSRILFSILFVYFLSENLIDNFPSMAMFYIFAGAFCRSAEMEKLHAGQAAPVDPAVPGRELKPV